MTTSNQVLSSLPCVHLNNSTQGSDNHRDGTLKGGDDCVQREKNNI
jgi:hypothetical protein